jgi:predicted transcriptional regulator
MIISKEQTNNFIKRKDVCIMAESTVKKVTKREYFAELTKIVAASEVENKADVLAFIEHEVELLNRKSSSGKLSKTQEENVVLMNTILEVLGEADAPMSIADIMADERVGLSNQKVTSLVSKLVKEEKVVRTTEKKKPYFSIA